MAKLKVVDTRHSHKSPKKKSATERRTPTELLEQAALHLQQSQPEQALNLASGALSQIDSITQNDPKTPVPALVLLAQINLELGEPDSARQLFLRTIALDPDGEISSAEPSLWMAQLSEEGGADSIRWFEKGVQILKDEVQYLEDLGPEDVEAQIVAAEKKLRMAEALCSMAEVYMTDLS